METLGTTARTTTSTATTTTTATNTTTTFTIGLNQKNVSALRLPKYHRCNISRFEQVTKKEPAGRVYIGIFI